MTNIEKTDRQAGKVESAAETPRSLRQNIGGVLRYVQRGDFRGLYRRLAEGPAGPAEPLCRIVTSSAYQSFPGGVGASDSIGKLKALCLPPLAGKTFLDVGCNEGFFCGFAVFQGAAKSVGLDQSPKFIAAARERFPECEFLIQSWDELPEGYFDVILLASSLHYADDQAGLVQCLVERLSPRGTLILELSIAPGNADEWVKVRRSIDERMFPTRRKLASVLKDYAWKEIGPSVPQAGDPLPRKVIHVSRRAPVAYLLMHPPAYGKTTIARTLFDVSSVPVISGDHCLARIAAGKLDVSEALRRVVEKDFSALRIDQSVRALFAAGLAADYVDSWLQSIDKGDFAFEGFVPREHHDEIVALLKDEGYLPVRLEWERFGDGPASAEHVLKEVERYGAFLASRQDMARKGDVSGKER